MPNRRGLAAFIYILPITIGFLILFVSPVYLGKFVGPQWGALTASTLAIAVAYSIHRYALAPTTELIRLLALVWFVAIGIHEFLACWH